MHVIIIIGIMLNVRVVEFHKCTTKLDNSAKVRKGMVIANCF